MSARAEVDAAARAHRASQWVGRVLWAVTAGAMVLAAATVTTWAIRHGMSPWVAWLVDPLLSVALLAALIGEAELSRHGWRGGAWPALLRWGAGAATLTANTWEAVAARDAAGVVLHSLPPLVIVVVAEAAPRLRRRLSELAEHLEAEAAGGSIGSAPTAAPTPVASTVMPDGIGSTRSSAPTPTAAPIGSTRPESIESTGSAPIGRAPRVERVRVESTPTAPPAPRTGARSIEACRAELAAAIRSGELPEAPSAEAIRRVLSVGPTRARALRDELAAAAVAPIPGQTALVDVDEPTPAPEAVDPIGSPVEVPALVVVGQAGEVAA